MRVANCCTDDQAACTDGLAWAARVRSASLRACFETPRICRPILARCLDKNPAGRPTAAVLVDEMRRWEEDVRRGILATQCLARGRMHRPVQHFLQPLAFSGWPRNLLHRRWRR